MMKILKTPWAVVLALVLGLAVQAQQQVNNFRVLTNLYVGGTTTLGGPISVGGVTLATNELSYLDGVTGPIQAQIDAIDPSGYSQTTRATSALFFGDSVVQGSSASSTANTWWYQVATHYGWSYTNLAFSGSVVTDLNWQSQPGYDHTNGYNSVLYTTPLATATNLTVFAKVGINDGADFPTTSGDHAAYLTHYFQSWLAFAAYWATPGKTLATAATASGTWTAWTNYFAASSGRQSTTSGDTLAFTTMGDAVYIAFPVSLTNTTSFGQFWVSIDGTAVELVDPNGVGFGNRNQYYSGGGYPVSYIPFAATNGFWAKRYSGYGQRRHTVLITATNNASLPTVINWVAGSQQPIGPNSGPSVFLLENLNRAADATRDATYSALRAQVNQVANQLGGDGLQVAIIRPNSVYDSANSGDGIHPNDAGMVQVAQAVRQAVDRFRGLAIIAGQGSSGSGLSAAGSGLSESSGTVSLGGTLTANATLTGGTYGVQASRTQANEPVLELFPGASTYGLEVTGDTSFMEVLTSSGSPSTYWRKANGTVASPTAALNGDNLGRLYFMGFGSGGYEFGAAILANAAENFSSTAAGSSLNFYTTPTTTDALQLAMTINASGNVVMAYDLTADDITGTSLSIPNAGATPAMVTRYNTGVSGANIHLRHARGTSGSPTALAANDSIGTINFVPYDGTGFNVSAAQITGFAGESMTGSAVGSGLNFFTTPTGSATPALAVTINPSGSVSLASGLSATTLTGNTTSTGLTLNGDGAFGIVANRNSSTGGKEVALQRSRASSTAVQSGDNLGIIGFYGHNGTTYPGRNAGVRGVATETHSGSAGGTRVIVSATPNGSTTATDQLVVNGSSIEVAGSIELGHATDTTLSRQSSGVVALESVPVIDGAVGTLTYSGTTVNITAGKGVAQEDTLTCTNSFSLTFSSLNNKDAGYVTIWPAATNCTITLPSYGFGPSGSTLTVNGGTGNTNYTVLTWFNTVVGGTNRVSVNALNYYR